MFPIHVLKTIGDSWNVVDLISHPVVLLSLQTRHTLQKPRRLRFESFFMYHVIRIYEPNGSMD